MLAEIRVPRPGRGRPRTRPDKVLADRAYTSRINRRHLARRGITGVIPQKRDEIASRQRKGSRGGRPPGKASGLRIAHTQVGWWQANGVFPVHFVWRTGLAESLWDAVKDSLPGKARGWATSSTS